MLLISLVLDCLVVGFCELVGGCGFWVFVYWFVVLFVWVLGLE